MINCTLYEINSRYLYYNIVAPHTHQLKCDTFAHLYTPFPYSIACVCIYNICVRWEIHVEIIILGIKDWDLVKVVNVNIIVMITWLIHQCVCVRVFIFVVLLNCKHLRPRIQSHTALQMTDLTNLSLVFTISFFYFFSTAAITLNLDATNHATDET